MQLSKSCGYFKLSQAGVKHKFSISEHHRHRLRVHMELPITRGDKGGKVMNNKSPKKSLSSLLFDSLL